MADMAAPMEITRCRESDEDRNLREFKSALHKLGYIWSPSCDAIVSWIHKVDLNVTNEIHEQWEVLILQLNMCVNLAEALKASGANPIQRLRGIRLNFRKMLQHQPVKEGWQALEALFQSIEQLNATTSAGRLSALKPEIQQKALELLGRFAKELPV